MEDPKNKKADDEHTPITDGDYRPDKQLAPDVPTTRRIRKGDQKKMTEKRAADTDRLEDFKDAL